MGDRRRRSKNAGRICEKHQSILHYYTRLYYRHQDPNRNEKSSSKNRRRKPQMDKKKDNEDRQQKLELRKK
jgi:hypothetical protein